MDNVELRLCTGCSNTLDNINKRVFAESIRCECIVKIVIVFFSSQRLYGYLKKKKGDKNTYKDEDDYREISGSVGEGKV